MRSDVVYSPVVILWSSAVLAVMCNAVAPLGCAIDVGLGWFFFFFSLIAKTCRKRFSLILYNYVPVFSRQILS